jgi:hypothetical protein
VETVPKDVVHVHLSKADADNLYALTSIWVEVLVDSIKRQDTARDALAIISLVASSARFIEELERLGAEDDSDASVDASE